MNNRKIEVKKRQIRNLIRPSNRKRNCFCIYSGETKKHMDLKYEMWFRLLKAGFEVYTEAIFTDGKRADITAISPHGNGFGIECLSSETIKECEFKLKSYPNTIQWFIAKDFNDIERIYEEIKND